MQLTVLDYKLGSPTDYDKYIINSHEKYCKSPLTAGVAGKHCNNCEVKTVQSCVSYILIEDIFTGNDKIQGILTKQNQCEVT